MKYSIFADILETMQAREKTESQLYEMGLDIANIPNDLSGCVMKLFDEIYPESKDVIGYFCYETNYGRDYKGGMEDVFGRTVDLYSIHDLHSFLEHQELSAWIHSEPYGEGSCLCAEGHYLGINFWVYWNGFALCAYLDVSNIEDADSVLDGIVHGGVTWVDNYLPFNKGYKTVPDGIVGWDYAHGGDYCKSDFAADWRKYTTHEIIVQIQEAIDAMRDHYKKI